MKTLIPVPPHGKLQEKKAALVGASDLLAELKRRVDEYDRLDTSRRSPHRQTPRPTIKAMYERLLLYPSGIYTNMLNFTEPMVHKADSKVSDCLALLRSSHISGLFTPDEYEQLARRLTLAMDLVKEVYFIETQRPNPGKVGTRPNARSATLETRMQATKPLDSPKQPVGQFDAKPLLARQHNLRAALDDLATVEHTGLVGEVAALLGGLESYQADELTQRDEPFIMVADGLVTTARGLCWQVMRANIVTPNHCKLLRRDLEKALSLVENCLSL